MKDGPYNYKTIEEEKIPEKENAVNLPVLTGDISLEKVSFKYDRDYALSDITLNVKKGEIYHFGFIPTAEKTSIQAFKVFIDSIRKSPQKSIHHENISISRLKCDDREEMVTVTNLTDNRFDNLDIQLNDVENDDNENQIILKDLTILDRSSAQWSVNKKISEYAYIKCCTSEINKISNQKKDDTIIYSVSGFHYKGSRNFLEINIQQLI